MGEWLRSLRGLRETAWFDWLDLLPFWAMWFGFFGFFRRWLLKKRESRRTGVARPSPISDRSQFKPEQIGESMKARAASQRTD